MQRRMLNSHALFSKAGGSILGGNFIRHETTSTAMGRWEELPYEPFRAAAAGWGNVNFLPDPDYGVRRFFPTLEEVSGQANIAWLPWAVARFIKAPNRPAQPPEATSAWLNYYGPPGTVPTVSYFLALLPEGVPPGFFKDKVVFVGGLLSADFLRQGQRRVSHPLRVLGARLCAGGGNSCHRRVEPHARRLA